MSDPLPKLPYMPFPEMYATNAENFNPLSRVDHPG